MSQQLPSWIIEQTLDSRHFNCCGDEDLFPFRCHECNHLFVLCYECHTLYANLRDLSQRSYPSSSKFACPTCNVLFNDQIMRSPWHRISYEEWNNANLQHLLSDCKLETLLMTLNHKGDQIADFLRRGMRSTAQTATPEYRNLAESIMVHVPHAHDARLLGYNATDPSTLSFTMAWFDDYPPIPNRSYALLGITDRLFP